MADSVADKHTDGNRNHDGSDIVYGVKKRVGHSNEVLHFIVPMRTKNKRTPFVDVRLNVVLKRGLLYCAVNLVRGLTSGVELDGCSNCREIRTILCQVVHVAT